MNPEQKVEPWQLSSYWGFFQGFLTWGGEALAVIYPDGHLSLPGLQVYSGFARRKEKNMSASFYRGCLVSNVSKPG